MKYENNDATFQVIIGILAMIVYNILNYVGLINIIFGSATNETIIQSITVLLMAVTTWIFARHNRKKRKIPLKKTDNKEIIKETKKVPTMIMQEMQHSHKNIKEIKEIKKNISISSFFIFLNGIHFHYPIIQTKNG